MRKTSGASPVQQPLEREQQIMILNKSARLHQQLCQHKLAWGRSLALSR